MGTYPKVSHTPLIDTTDPWTIEKEQTQISSNCGPQDRAIAQPKFVSEGESEQQGASSSVANSPRSTAATTTSTTGGWWKHQLLLILEGYGLEGFVLGTVPSPSPFVIDSEA
ncbi:hypothetical protein Gotri_005664 [Gossypium trilobum]|uniref:Uncharacterized protein n=1 Tax=Gossypium trilobum TaxID=34281 RepID=A0A7J9EXN9_9ROSI|nr:hypothetical protein [Gossypium trilobum]